MKKHVLGFIRRGSSAAWIGPLVLAVIYLILQKTRGIAALTVNEVAIGIISISALAFIAGGMNFIYHVERISLPVAILIHACVLYATYLLTYLLNDWLEWSTVAILVFSVIFIVGYLAIWAVIYSIIRKSTARINEMLIKKQSISEEN